MRIRDTRNVEKIYISEAMLEEARSNENIEILEEPKDWDFNEEGNLW